MRLYIYGAVVLALVGVAFWLHRQGGESIRTEIEKKDTQAGNRSDEARSRFDLCPAGKWDFGRAKCLE
ncbi:hypothetical protein F406_gp106 [Agrobacterium phage 7-7-1]|uniref:Uncharacterized protein n=1 Tax=Agrobacterium phage 7-7-1 TaxID=1161931 RepID=J7FA57_9CAUD|nr:hypothetical protein F406_gp106 [Agrobacterium phage 7-7-1]AFH19709.1 hypothetical protein 7-7-1_00011 [Agrobacterium phage 7-7-1]